MPQTRVPFLRVARSSDFLTGLPSRSREHFVAVCGELVGTCLFLFFAFAGTQVANSTLTGESTLTPILYIALSFGFSLAVNAWVFFRISGGLFNPAVTLGMCLVGAVTWLRGVLLFAAQILAGILAAAVASAVFPDDLVVQTTLNAGTSVTQGFFIEMFLTVELVFTIFMLAAEKHKATFVAPIGIGLALFVSELAGVNFTGGSLNPARSFGPALVLWSFPNYHWIYWIGPFLGAILAAGFYKLMKMFGYETANPGQDHDGQDISAAQIEKGTGIDDTNRYLPAPPTGRLTEQVRLDNQRKVSRREEPASNSRDRTVTRGILGSDSTASSGTNPSDDSMHPAVEVQPNDLQEQPDVRDLESSVQDNLVSQPMSGNRTKSKERHNRQAHMWAEGHHIDADGHCTWV